MVGEMALQNTLRPLVVEMHVSAPRQQKGRTRQSRQHNDAQGEDDRKNVVLDGE
jgi:hypothetical protein